MKRSLVAVCILLAIGSPALAWSSAAHQVIAAGVYRGINHNGIQAWVDKTLQAHPDYNKWVAEFKPTDGVSQRMFVFMKAATWPDEIRRHHNAYDHPHWHYVDHPLRPPSFPVELAPESHDDVIFGIQESEIAAENR